MAQSPCILSVEELVIAFNMYEKGFKKKDLEVIHKLSLEVHQGEIVAVVGSSGSGKSLLAHAILNLLPKNAKVSGKISYKGKKLDEEVSHRKIMIVIFKIIYFVELSPSILINQ